MSDLDLIVQSFRQRPNENHLSLTIRQLLNARNATRGINLREGKLAFDNFDAAPFLDDLTWTENPFNDRNWQWNLHNLVLLRYLLAAHHKTHEEWFLRRAETLLEDWVTDNYLEQPPCEFSWGDHTAALRLETLLYYLEYARTHDISHSCIRTLIGAIHTHASVLMDEEFYNKHTNHGLDQSVSLYLAGACFPEFEDAGNWERVGRVRTIDELTATFTSEGVHIENSPGYHLMMLRRALHVDAAFRHHGGHNDLRGLLDNAFRFAAYVIRPDGTLPIVGDTQAERVRKDGNLVPAQTLPGYEEFKYSITRGADGSAPESSSRVFPKSGYAIFRDSWESPKSLYLLFKAGFLSSFHRQDDDLSFVLFKDGEDWIIDSGLYRYQEKDSIRRYVRSAHGHNTVIVDDASPSRARCNIEHSHIDDFLITDAMASVTGSHTLYSGVTVSRTVTYQKPSLLSINDVVNMEDGEDHRFQLLFHIPSDKTVRVHNHRIDVCSTRSDTRLSITPVRGPVTSVSLVEGRTLPSLQGWVSHTYGHVEKSLCVIYEGVGRSWESEVELRFEGYNGGKPRT